VANIAAACPIFGHRIMHAHYLQPPAQLGIAPSQRSLELASLPQWCHDDQRLRMLCCCSPLSFVAYRLASVIGHEDACNFQRQAIVFIIKRSLSIFARRHLKGNKYDEKGLN
jgi:hypothetical protein